MFSGGAQAENGGSGFIFTESKAVNSANPKEFVRIGERLPITQLKKRFSRYKVESTAGEDCLICATVTSSHGSLEVNYDENGIMVIGIFSYDKSSADALGNSVGLSLLQAIGNNEAECDEGMWTACASPKLNGLWYIVDENESCKLSVASEGATTIPPCARIEGFEIQKHR